MCTFCCVSTFSPPICVELGFWEFVQYISYTYTQWNRFTISSAQDFLPENSTQRELSSVSSAWSVSEGRKTTTGESRRQMSIGCCWDKLAPRPPPDTAAISFLFNTTPQSQQLLSGGNDNITSLRATRDQSPFNFLCVLLSAMATHFYWHTTAATRHHDDPTAIGRPTSFSISLILPTFT